MSESDLTREIQRDTADPYTRLWRNNTGTAWQGSKTVRLPNGDMLIKNPRPVHFGLAKGSSDLIGLRSVKVLPDMVGKTLAVFVACEVKRPNHKTDPDLLERQTAFIDLVQSFGGRAGFATSVEEALAILDAR